MEFRVLGPLEVGGRDGPVLIGSVQQRRVLARLLVAEGSLVPADALVAALWDGPPPVTALRALRNHVFELRSRLGLAGTELLMTRPSGYVLDVAPDAVDARRFERLVAQARAVRADRPHVALERLDQALALWRGSALAEFADADWARPHVARWDELRLVAVEERLEARLALERHVVRRRPAPAWSPEARVGLPAEVSSFIGRETEIAAVWDLLHEARVVTLTGVGGVGKTRLALRTAMAVAERDEEAHWCDLAPAADAAAVAHTVARAVGVPLRAGRTVEDAIAAALRSRRLLLVLDSCEHVAEAASGLIEHIVGACPRVTVLATSRSRLGVTGEHVWPVPPLPAGNADDAAAVALFRDRARTARSGADLRDTGAIGVICRRLDGLPLAVELAAARLRALTLDDLVEQLDDSDAPVTSAREGGCHSALRMIVDWSYGLLSETERRVFDRLSVFAGGFSPTAAETVCADATGGAVSDVLTRLVDSSMISAVDGPEERRYHMPATLRQYGADRLVRRGVRDAVRAIHTRYFVDVAETVARRMRGPAEAEAVAVVERELGNLRAAHRWAVETGDVDCASRLVVALRWDAFWRMRDEVFRWTEATVTLPRAYDHHLFPVACGVAAWGAGVRGQFESARELATRGLSVAPGHDPRAVWPLCVLAHLALWWGRLDDSARYGRTAAQRCEEPYDLVLPLEVQVLALSYAGRRDEALAVADSLQRLADPLANPSAMALARYARGEALLDADPRRAMGLMEEAIRFCAAVDNRVVAGVAGVSLTSLRARNGPVDEALRSFRDVIEPLRRAGDRTRLWADLRSLVVLFARVGAERPAAVLHGAVTGAATAPPVHGADARRLTTVAAALRDRLGAAALAAAQAQGCAMADDEIVAYVTREIDRALHGGGHC